jgi:hypothetical protein
VLQYLLFLSNDICSNSNQYSVYFYALPAFFPENTAALPGEAETEGYSIVDVVCDLTDISFF